MQTKQEVLQACRVSGMLVTLPAVQLDRKLYQEVAKALDLIGGKWDRKEQGFVFNECPADLLKQISNGEKRNLQKEFQFFGTPDFLADELVQDANIEEYDLILEPSAGQGSIIKAIHRIHPGYLVHYCELMPINRTFLEKLPNVAYITDNFLKLSRSKVTMGVFDKIIANPPFSKNQDVDHIRQMFDCLKPGGRLVSIASNHWKFGSNKKETAFKNWIYEIGADVQAIEAGTFEESGTKIATCKIIIDKE